MQGILQVQFTLTAQQTFAACRHGHIQRGITSPTVQSTVYHFVFCSIPQTTKQRFLGKRIKKERLECWFVCFDSAPSCFSGNFSPKKPWPSNPCVFVESEWKKKLTRIHTHPLREPIPVVAFRLIPKTGSVFGFPVFSLWVLGNLFVCFLGYYLDRWILNAIHHRHRRSKIFPQSTPCFLDYCTRRTTWWLLL